METIKIKKDFFRLTKHSNMDFVIWEKKIFPSWAKDFLSEWKKNKCEEGIDFIIPSSFSVTGKTVLYKLTVKEIRQCNNYTAKQWEGEKNGL